MSDDREKDLRAFVEHCEQVTVPGVVLGSDHLAIVRHALALHEKLENSEVEVARLESLFQCTQGVHHSWVAKAQEAERLEAEVARLTAERDGYHDDYWSRVSEVERLTRELEDVQKLDEWLTGETSGECRDWEMMHDTLTTGTPWYCTLSSSTGVESWDHDAVGATPAAARRAAVEYLEREQRVERICLRCGSEYVSDRLCPGSNYTLMCRDPGSLPDGKEET